MPGMHEIAFHVVAHLLPVRISKNAEFAKREVPEAVGAYANAGRLDLERVPVALA